MDVLVITASDTLRVSGLHAATEGEIGAVIGCEEVARVDLYHDVALWFDAHHSNPRRPVNHAAVCLLLDCSALDEDEVPIPADTVVLTGTDRRTGAPSPLRRWQYVALAETLYRSGIAGPESVGPRF